MFNIIEKFISIDGEGPTAGQLATFIRFQGCNLRCEWCDTKYSFSKNQITENLSAEEIYGFIKKSKTRNVTLTGGEPLIQQNIDSLLEILNNDSSLTVHIETNGSVNILQYKNKYKNLIFIVDYKLPSSKMTENMLESNLKNVSENDVYKFVIASTEDLEKAYKVIQECDLDSRCKVYFSPVTGSIDYKEIIEFMINKNLDKVTFQVQLHKIVWGAKTRGV